MNARISDISEFNYTRSAYKVRAYGKEYELPVRTTAFCDKQDAIDRELTDTTESRPTAEIVKIVRRGIALFIGQEDMEKLFPESEIDSIDIDELFCFYSFLKTKSTDNLKAYTNKYAPAASVRKK